MPDREPRIPRAPSLALALPVLAAGLLAGCAAPAGGGEIVPAPTGAFDGVGFADPVLIDADRWSGEPSIAVDSSGALYVTAAGGSARLYQGAPQNPEQGYGQSYLWKSADGGRTWAHLDLGAARYRNAAPGVEGDVAVDAMDRVYFVDLPAASVSISVSEDGGRTWLKSNPALTPVPADDRPWVDATGDGIVYVSYVQLPSGVWVSKSTDAALTFPQHTLATRADRAGPVTVDPTDPDVAYVPFEGDGVRVAVTRDGGATFEDVRVAQGGAGPLFPVLDVDDAGGVHLVWTREAEGGGRRVVLASSPDRGATWSAPVVVGPASGTAIMPWISAGAAGRVAVAWYATAANASAPDAAPDESEWRVQIALGEGVGSTAPAWRLATLTESPIKRGPICSGGLRCVTGGDRRLLDFFEIAVGPDGAAHVAYTDVEAQGAPRIGYVGTQGSARLR